MPHVFADLCNFQLAVHSRHILASNGVLGIALFNLGRFIYLGFFEILLRILLGVTL